MTLDPGCKPTIKGHFCSLLISNIFCVSSLSVIYLFSLCTLSNLQIANFSSLTRTPFCVCGRVASKGEFLICLKSPCRSHVDLFHTHLGNLEDRRLCFHWTVPPFLDYSIAQALRDCNIQTIQSSQYLFVKNAELVSSAQKTLYKCEEK